MRFRGHLPDFLHADPELGHVRVGVERVSCDHLLGERPANAFRQKDVLAVQFHAGLMVFGRRAVGIPSELARDHALDLAAIADHQFGARHAGKDFDPQGLGLAGHPAAHVPHRHDVVAMVAHQRRHHEIGHPDLSGLAEQPEPVPSHFDADRSALFLPVWNQPGQSARIQDGARKNVGADLGPLFQDDDIQACIQLLEPNCCRQAGRASTHDHDVVLHAFAFDHGHGSSFRVWCGHAYWSLAPWSIGCPESTRKRTSARPGATGLLERVGETS